MEEEIEKLGAEIMELSRNMLLVDHRFLDAAISKLTLSQSDKTETFMTDGKTLYYAPLHVLRLYKAEKDSVARSYLHIVLHCVLCHSFVGKKIDRLRWDLACDIAVEQIDDFRRIYEGAGYKVIETSARTGEGVEELREACRDKVCLFSGESGVGKSSLIKALDPSLSPKIGRISETHLQGKHTTTFYEMYPICSGGFVVDTPGLRGFGLVDLEKEEIALYFPEMLKFAQDCRFAPCTHTHEPGCAVKQAVEDGLISPERYSSYLGMLEEDKKFR